MLVRTCHVSQPDHVKGRRRGYTLAELLIVLVILAALAALVVARLGGVKDQADHATSASGASELANNLEIYKAQTGKYPLRMDSLLEGSGSGAPSGVAPIFWVHPPLVAPAAPPWLTMDNLVGSYRGSLAHAGISQVMDHSTAASDPSSSGVNGPRTLDSTNSQLAVVDLANGGTTAARILNAAGYVDSTHLGDTKLVALGIGPRCGLVGATLANVPRHSAAEPTHYGRFIAIFAVFNNSSKSAQLKTVVDSRGFPIDYRINQYKLTGPTQE